MATARQIEANRTNAQSSTGPKTEEGKRNSSFNSVRHGLTGQSVVLTEDQVEPYRLFLEGIEAELKPGTTIESSLVLAIASARWRISQIAALESALYALGIRQYLDQFSEEPLETAIALARVLTFEQKRKEFDRLRRYESQLHRQCQADQAELQRIQLERKEREASHNRDAIALLTHFTALGQDWNPADFGFVLSIEEIQQLEQRQFTLTRARQASVTT
jgi:hypothetical protein